MLGFLKVSGTFIFLKQFYMSGINCKAENAVKEMQMVKQIYGKENGIIAFHGEQSFKEREATPELAHEIGVRLTEELKKNDGISNKKRKGRKKIKK